MNEKLVDDIRHLVVTELKDLRKDIGEIKMKIKEQRKKCKRWRIRVRV